MKRQALHYYLQDLNRLDDISLESLKSWANEESYCQNIHYLIAKKMVRDEQTTDLEPFHRAATYAVDRNRLASFLDDNVVVVKEVKAKEVKSKTPVVAKPKVAKKTKRIVEKVESIKPIVKTKVESLKKDIPKLKGNKNEGEQLDYKEIPLKKKKRNSPKGKKTTTSKKAKKKKLTKTSTTKLKVSSKKTSAKKPKEKKLKLKETSVENLENYIRKTDSLSEFNQWLLDLRTQGGQKDIPYIDMAEKSKKSKKKSKKDKKSISKESRNKRASEDIISESLAHLLAKQGRKKKAIRMYKRLSLIIPEKSVFFASQIKALKKEE